MLLHRHGLELFSRQKVLVCHYSLQFVVLIDRE